MTRNMRLLFGCIFFAVMFAYTFAILYRQNFVVGSHIGWRGESKDGRQFLITGNDAQTALPDLRPGDELLAINGKSPREMLLWNDTVPPGTPFSFTIRRAGQVIEYVSRTLPYPTAKEPKLSTQDRLMPFVFLIFLMTGLVVLLLRPDNWQAWILSLMLGAFIGLFSGDSITMVSNPFTTMIVPAAKFLSAWFFPLFLIFFLNFPERLPLLRRYPRLDVWLFLPLCLFVLPVWPLPLPPNLIEQFRDLPVVNWWNANVASKLVLPTMAAYLIAGLLVLPFSYYAANHDSRKRARIALAGSAIGFIALLLLVLEGMLGLRNYATYQPLSGWVQALFPYVVALIPLSFAYAIIRHKVIPISFIIRQGLRYLLVKRGATLLVILLLWLLVTRVLSSLFFHWQPSGLTVGWISAAATIAAMQLSKFVNQQFLAPVIDRKFFRQSYDAQQIIAELNQSIRTVTDQPQLLEQVATRIQSALQTKNVAIFLHDPATGNYAIRYFCDYEVFGKYLIHSPRDIALRDVQLPADGTLLKQAADNTSALEVESVLAESERQSESVGDALKVGVETTDTGRMDASLADTKRHLTTELAALDLVNAALLLPVKAKDDLLGVITVGPRLGDLPFSNEDKRLLLSVAAPTAFALENARLVERMIAEARRREEIQAENEARARELEEARQLQLSMLPKKMPDLPYLEIAAYMKTATEVGGDYYDFAVGREGVLTIAIGDATGHGLKAGTIVTATKSLFNAHVHDESLAATFGLMSRALKLMNLRGMFMALTLVRLENDTLRIASAGMPPLLLYRAATGEVEEHLQKAVPLGSIKQYPYSEFSLAFAPGDLLLLMSDGLPERFNGSREVSQKEMLGYEPIKRLIADYAQTTSPQALIEDLLALGDNWSEGSPQDDDITLLILKAK